MGITGQTKGAVMENSKVVDKRQIRLEDLMKPGYIPFLGGRPKRQTVITADDVTNLSIALNTTMSVEELITKI
jgi:hypothetical protein